MSSNEASIHAYPKKGAEQLEMGVMQGRAALRRLGATSASTIVSALKVTSGRRVRVRRKCAFGGASVRSHSVSVQLLVDGCVVRNRARDGMRVD